MFLSNHGTCRWDDSVMVWGYCISEDVSWGWQVIQPPSRGRYLPRTGMGASKALTWVPLEKVVLWRSSKCASVTAIISARTLNWSNVTARGRSRYNTSIKLHVVLMDYLNNWWFRSLSDHHPVYSEQWALGPKRAEPRLLRIETQTSQIWGGPLVAPRSYCGRGGTALWEASRWGWVEVHEKDLSLVSDVFIYNLY